MRVSVCLCVRPRDCKELIKLSYGYYKFCLPDHSINQISSNKLQKYSFKKCIKYIFSMNFYSFKKKQSQILKFWEINFSL